jgi:antitoxin VapB
VASLRKARVFQNGRSQAVRIPAEFRFTSDEVYIERNPRTGAVILSEEPPRPSLSEIYKELDEAGAADFELNRDLSLPVERDWL